MVIADCSTETYTFKTVWFVDIVTTPTAYEAYLSVEDSTFKTIIFKMDKSEIDYGDFVSAVGCFLNSSDELGQYLEKKFREDTQLI